MRSGEFYVHYRKSYWYCGTYWTSVYIGTYLVHNGLLLEATYHSVTTGFQPCSE